MAIECDSESSSDNEDQWLTDDDEEASDPDMLGNKTPILPYTCILVY